MEWHSLNQLQSLYLVARRKDLKSSNVKNSNMDCVNDLGKEYISPFDAFIYSLYYSLPYEAEPAAPAPVAAAPAPPPVAAVRSPLCDISPPPSPPLFPQHDDDMDMGARRRRVPASESTTLSASSSRNVSDNIKERPIIGLPRGRKSNTPTTTSNDNKHISEPEEPELDDRERRPSAAERNTLTYAATSQNNATSSHFNKTNSKRDLDDVNMDVENLDFNFSPTTRQLSRTYRPSPSTSVDVPLRLQLQERRKDRSFDFDLLDEIDQDENQPPPPGPQQRRSSATAAAVPPPQRDLKSKGRAEPFSPFFVGQQCQKRSLSLSKIDDPSSDDYGMMGMDDNDFADAEFLEKLDRVEMEALSGGGDANKSHVATTGGVGLVGLLPLSVSGSGSIGRSSGSGSGSGSYVLLDGDKQTSSSASAPVVSSSLSSTKHVDIIEIDSTDEDEEMLGTDDKENEPVATRHVRRRTEDLDEGVGERGRGLFASQGWNPLLAGGSHTRSSRLGGQNQNQNQSQGLKPRVLAKSPADVIDLSDSD